jgi:hypothetical protein
LTVHLEITRGTVLAGKYCVERVLGRGGMGLVVEAMHLQLGQPVAMKFLLAEVLEHPQITQRFLREAQAAVRLRSEHVARVIDVGTLETGAPYMVLEYLEGADLANFPRDQLSIGRIIDLILQACEALAEAHALGIVHRDIKPANLFITRRVDGTPLLKVLDFGISKVATVGAQLTATQAVMGTPAYMSPEQIRASRDVDHRTDIWSLGVVLYELLQGNPPFAAETFSSMVLKVVTEPLPRLTVRLPGDLEAIVYRCLEKDPARRFGDTAELARAIARYAQSETQAAVSVQRTGGIVGRDTTRRAIEPQPGERVPLSTLSGSAGASTLARRAGWRWPAAALLGGAILVGIAVVASRGDGISPQALGAPARGGSAPAAAQPTPNNAMPVAAPPPAAAPARAATPAIDSGEISSSGAPDAGVSDAPAAAPPRRPTTGRRVQRSPAPGDNHASSTGSAAPSAIDRGD